MIKIAKKKDCYYSGDNSKTFWDRVNSLPNKYRWEIYSQGCLLQNFEDMVLVNLEKAEKLSKKRKKNLPK